MSKKHPVGLGHAAVLCQMSAKDRLAFLAEGLPLILASAEGFQAGAEALRDRPRETDVLEGFAAEEAAKVLILIDMQRCPKAVRSQQTGTSIRWFYDHLARLLYADAVKWKPSNKGELRSYIDRHRRSHGVDGPVGEYILPSGPVYDRERRLYADVERYDDRRPMWNAPRSWKEGLPATSIFNWPPAALRLAQAMQRLGMFTEGGLAAVADIWGGETLTDAMTPHEAIALSEQMLRAIEAKGLVGEDATEDDMRMIYHDWPFPMWDFDLSLVSVPLEELEEERDRNFWSEAGY